MHHSWVFFESQGGNVVCNRHPLKGDKPICSKLQNLVSCNNQGIQSDNGISKSKTKVACIKLKGLRGYFDALIYLVKEPKEEHGLIKTGASNQ